VYAILKNTTLCKEKCLAVAVSNDGFRWLKRGLCLEPSPSGTDASSLDDGGVARCNVVRNATYDKNTQTWNEEPGYIMYYEGVSTTDQKHRILSATSSDGRSWTKTNDKGPVLDIGDADEETWDCDGVGSPHILRYVTIT